jgi:hypothetical protein
MSRLSDNIREATDSAAWNVERWYARVRGRPLEVDRAYMEPNRTGERLLALGAIAAVALVVAVWALLPSGTDAPTVEKTSAVQSLRPAPPPRLIAAKQATKPVARHRKAHKRKHAARHHRRHKRRHPRARSVPVAQPATPAPAPAPVRTSTPAPAPAPSRPAPAPHPAPQPQPAAGVPFDSSG